MANLTFYGAADGVTGSCYLIETENARLLLECGLIQGSRKAEIANAKPFPFERGTLDAVVLSHAHLDHSGRLPKLVADGYSGSIYMTEPTCELLEILLRDAASLQLKDAEWDNKRRRRAGKREIEPLFTEQDVDDALALCECFNYGQRQVIADGVEVCFRDAGHILGSSIVELFLNENGIEKKLVFSGDLGNSEVALLRDPSIINTADVLLMESTYGDRDHQPMAATLEEFNNIMVDASQNGGNILIPSFAVGRTQELIFRLGEMYQQGLIKQQAIYLDSPMAIAVTEIYHRYQNIFNREDNASLRQGKNGSLHSFLPVLRYTSSTAESMALNRLSGGTIIIAGSGMCNGGRIRHHLKHNLWRNNAHVVIVGYQAIGTPGRALVDGEKTYRIGGERIVVNAQIHTLGGFSAHASQSQLIDWVQHFEKPHPRLYLIHGEDDAKTVLKERLQQLGWSANIPKQDETINF